MMQNAASNILNILTSRPASSDSGALPVPQNQAQGADFKRILGGLGGAVADQSRAGSAAVARAAELADRSFSGPLSMSVWADGQGGRGQLLTALSSPSGMDLPPGLLQSLGLDAGELENMDLAALQQILPPGFFNEWGVQVPMSDAQGWLSELDWDALEQLDAVEQDDAAGAMSPANMLALVQQMLQSYTLPDDAATTDAEVANAVTTVSQAAQRLLDSLMNDPEGDVATRLRASFSELPDGPAKGELVASIAKVLGIKPESLNEVLAAKDGKSFENLLAQLNPAWGKEGFHAGRGPETQLVNRDATAAQGSYFDQLMNQSSPTGGGDLPTDFNTLVTDSVEGFDLADSVDLVKPAVAQTAQSLTAQKVSDSSALKSYTTMVPQSVHDDGWIDNMGEKIMWLGTRGIKAAEIHLNPAELGPVEVKVKVHNDQTTVTFNVQNATVREMLESNVHRLRDLMSANGVVLDDVHVGGGGAEQQQERFAGEDGRGDKRSSGAAGISSTTDLAHAMDDEPVAVTPISSASGIDYYA